MIEFTHTDVMNLEGAIRGMRNSWESHEKSDSGYEVAWNNQWYWKFGESDKALAMKLAKSGSSHSKFMRQILVCVDIDAPLYWWKEFDQYKVGTVTNSESTMHTLSRKPMTKELFSIDLPDSAPPYHWNILDYLEHLRGYYIQTKEKAVLKYLIQLLPSGWMQKRTTTLNYAVIRNAYHDRLHHRLTEWHDFCTWAESLPYSELIVGEKNEKAE